jgi:glycosyltransferase involved in cell wall biosynthesis
MPLVSVLIPNYNCSLFIGRAIDSIINQTVSNWELLICDDGSVDNSVTIIRQWQEKDGRIRLLINERNEGHIYSYNRLFREAAGDYIMIQDADDWSDATRIERQLNVLQRTNAQICVCNSVFHSEQESESYQLSVESGFINIATRETWSPATIFFNRVVLEKVDGFSYYFNRTTSMDRYFIMDALSHYKGYYVDEYLYHVLVRPNSDHRSIDLNSPDYLRKIIIHDVYLTLKQQRISTGKDFLAENDMTSLNELEKKLIHDKVYLSEKLRIFACVQIDHDRKLIALKLLFKAISMSPFNLKNYRTLFYLIRK